MADLVKVGPWGPKIGHPCDINSQSKPQRLKTITICSSKSSSRIFGFSFVYVDQTGKEITIGPWGNIDPQHSTEINMTPGEHLNNVSGTADGSGITSLKLATNLTEHGTYGNPVGAAFELPVEPRKGEVVAFFGRSGDTLKALGVHVLRKKKSPVKVGPWGGHGGSYRDLITSNMPEQLQSITVYSTQCNGGRIYGFAFTYIDQNKKSIPVHPWGTTNENPETFYMDQGEYVNKLTGTADDYGVTSLTFTTNQDEYGPFGCPSGTAFSVPLPDNSTEDGDHKHNGALVAFFGSSGDSVVAIGAYIGVAPKPGP